MLKKCICLLLVLIFALSILSAAAQAGLDGLYIGPVNTSGKSNDEPVPVERGEEFDLYFYTVSLQPVDWVWGGMMFDSRSFLLIDHEICCSSEEDGALLRGDMDPEPNSNVFNFDVSTTSDDADDFAEFYYENKGYIMPLIRLRMKLDAPDGVYPMQYFLLGSVKDITGKLLFDGERGFQDRNFRYGVIVREVQTGGLRGDADSDGEVTILDSTRIQRRLAELCGDGDIDLTAADADLDGEVTILDATRIQRYLAELSDMDGDPIAEKPTEPFTEPITEPYTEPPVPPSTEPLPGVLPAPVIKAESNNAGAVISWNAVTGAEAYRVFMKNGSSWKTLGDTTATSFIHTDAAFNKEYIYTVRCVSGDGSRFTSDYDQDGCRNTRLRTPVLKSAKLTDGFIGVSWEQVTGAEAYRVYIKGGRYNSWTWIYDTDINYIDVDTALAELESDTEYTFTVRCVDEVMGSRLTSGFDPAGVSATYYDTPYLYGIVNTADGIELYWTEVSGAAKYRVFEWANDKWNKLYDTEDTALLVTGLTRGEYYRFTVRGLDRDGNYLTPYDCFGRMMDWDPAANLYEIAYSVSNIADNCDSYASRLGYAVDVPSEALSDAQQVYLLDCTDYYSGNTEHIEELITDRCTAMIDYYTNKLRRNGEDPADYSCAVVAEADENDHIRLYLVLTLLRDAE